MITIEACLPDESIHCGQYSCQADGRWRVTAPDEPVARRCSAHVMALVVLLLAKIEQEQPAPTDEEIEAARQRRTVIGRPDQ